MSSLLTPTIINKKTQLRKVLSLPKGLKRYFYVEDKNIGFWPQNLAFSSISCVKAQGMGFKKSKKSIFSKWVIFWPQLL